MGVFQITRILRIKEFIYIGYLRTGTAKLPGASEIASEGRCGGKSEEEGEEEGRSMVLGITYRAWSGAREVGGREAQCAPNKPSRYELSSSDDRL